MRIIDLILLLNDFKPNNRVFIELPEQRLLVVDIQIANEQVLLETSTKVRGLKNWEFILLINKKEYYEFPVFYDDKKNHQQLFGFRVADDCILLG